MSAESLQTAQPAKRRPKVKRSISVTIQYQNSEWNNELLTNRAIIAWSAKFQKDPQDAVDIQLYVQPAVSKVYYVINGNDGSYAL